MLESECSDGSLDKAIGDGDRNITPAEAIEWGWRWVLMKEEDSEQVSDDESDSEPLVIDSQPVELGGNHLTIESTINYRYYIA